MNALHFNAFSTHKRRALALMAGALLLASCASQHPDRKAPDQQAPAAQLPTATAPAATAPSTPPSPPAKQAPPAEPQQPAPTPAALSAPMPAPVTTTAPAPKPAPAAVAVKPAPVKAIAAPEKPAAEKTEPVKPAPAKPEKPAIPATETTPPPTTQPAPVTTTAAPLPTAVPAPAAEAITVSLDNLPLSIHNQWTLDRSESRCTLQSATQRMDDGQGGTRVSLWLTATELAFLTESEIDLSYTGTGLTIDGRTFALETVERRTNPVFSKQRNAILAAMRSGQTLQLSLGFWPTWPVTHTYSVSFPIQHFGTAYSAWETCNRLLNQR